MQLRIAMTLASSLIFIMVSGCAGGLKGLGVEQETILEESAAPSSPPPDWVLGKGHPRYPQRQYLIGVGISDKNSVSANESARSNLAKNLKVKIHSTMVDVSTTEQTYVESVIETEVDTVLEGVEIKDGWLDENKGVYYSLAIVERSLVASSIQNRISKIESALQRNLSEGMEAESRAEVVTSLSYYLAGYQKAPTLSPLKSALHVITRSQRNAGSQNINASEFESRIKGIVQNLNLATISGDQQIVKTQKGVAEPLVAKVYLLKGGNQIPVSNIPVIFNYEIGQGELEQQKTSGSDGAVQTTIHKISSYEDSNHVIEVKLDYSRIRSNFNSNFVEKLLSPLKNKRATFNYAVQTPKWASNKSQAWRESITDLSNQLIRNIPPEKNPLLGVMPFKDLRYERVTPFSRVLKEDIKTLLARADDLKLKEIEFTEDQQPGEIAKANSLDYYVSGSYRMERGGLEIRSRLIDTQTQNIQSSAHILIERKELNPEDLVLIDTMADEFKSAQKKKSYQEQLEKLVAAKPYKSSFDAKVWTDKKEYEINEKIVFYVKADKNGYLTLLDVGPNGNITVIFPNKYHRENFIRAGVTYQVPSPNYGFEFDVQGPAGLERIKAIVTLNKVSLLKLDLDKGFHSVKGETTRGTRTIQALSKQVDSVDSTAWAEAYSEIFIFKKGETYTRGSRKIPILEEPQKPIDMIGTFGNEQNKN
jgi:TolB-like protein